jgi:EAL domain-containing protein (putative c-di-GMP-specific phosphodiesterase class I)
MTMGHGLGLPILAEGVETEDQLAFLVREACDEVQGALIGGAHPLDQYAAMLGRASAQAPADRGRVDTVG